MSSGDLEEQNLTSKNKGSDPLPPNSDTKTNNSIINNKNINSHKIDFLKEDIDTTDLVFKIIIIGNSAVGKSSITQKLLHFNELLNPHHSATVGFELFTASFKVDEKSTVKLHIWDTCGQEEYRSLITGFYRNSSLAIIVYAINDRKSFDDIGIWIKELKSSSSPDAKLLLIGNKNDLESERQIRKEEAEKTAKNYDFIKFYETSAKSGFNIKKVFSDIVAILYEDYLQYNNMNMAGNINQMSLVGTSCYNSMIYNSLLNNSGSNKINKNNLPNKNNKSKNYKKKNNKSGCC